MVDRLDTQKPSALVVHRGALGDFILSLRVVATIRKSGIKHITILGRPWIAHIGLYGGVDEIIDMDEPGFHWLHAPADSDCSLPKSLKSRLANFNWVILFSQFSDGPSELMSKRLADLTGGQIIRLSPFPLANAPCHVTNEWLEELSKFGLAQAVPYPQLRLPEALTDEGRMVLKKTSRPVVSMHPGSGGQAKCWPLEHFLRLANEVKALGCNPIFITGHVEQELWTASSFQSLSQAASTYRNQPLLESASLIAASDIFVGNDSGMTHLAAAMGMPTLAIFGPTNPKIWAPLGPRVTVVARSPWPSIEDVLSEIKSLLSS